MGDLKAEVGALHHLVRLKNKELRTIRRLAETILSQRTEVVWWHHGLVVLVCDVASVFILLLYCSGHFGAVVMAYCDCNGAVCVDAAVIR